MPRGLTHNGPSMSRRAVAPLTPPPATVSLIVPVHDGGDALARCLDAALRLSPPPLEVIVVEDGLAQRRGPAAARNRGAEVAAGDILFFIDADVLVPQDAIATVQATLADPALSALIGSYDRHPAEPNFVSQFKNLAHRFVHQHAHEDGFTFWGACGAIRRSVFESLGGFDERFDEPSIEDIELGVRMVRRGARIRVHKDLGVTHLKRWTLRGLISTDVRRRALPWSALLLAGDRLPDDLNVRWRARVAVGLTALLLASLSLSALVTEVVLVALVLAAALWAVDRRLWSFFAAERGWWFAVRAVPMQWLYYSYCGAAFAWVWLTGDWRRARAAARLPESG
jgi:cellulose synthase/poly-beta-1,6-N-acetylglucosamine synthase-like glycosyltransferase